MIYNEFQSYAKLCKEQRNVLFEYDKEVAKQKYMNNSELDDTEEKPDCISACVSLVQKILTNTPESEVELFQLLLDFKYKVEEGIGEKE